MGSKPMTTEKIQFIILRDAINEAEGNEKAAIEGAILDARKVLAYWGEDAVIAFSYVAADYLDSKGQL
jgi:hypothetical protein